MFAAKLMFDTQTLVLFAILAVLVIVGIVLGNRFRQSIKDAPTDTSDLLSNFREMHARGELSEEEYRTIRSTLSARLRQELSDHESAGKQS